MSWVANNTGDLTAAIEYFHSKLPGWWFSVGVCHVSADASCAPDSAGCDFDLLRERSFDEGFHADLLPPATMADALRKVTDMAVAARAAYRVAAGVGEVTDANLDDVFLYVIGTRRDGKVQSPTKVGISAQPYSRFSNLQTASPYELVLVKAFRLPTREIALEMEDCFHSTQKASRLKGEWFEIDPREATCIVSLHIRWALECFTNLNEDELKAAFELAGVA